MALVFDGILHSAQTQAVPDDGRRVVKTIHGKVKSRIYFTAPTVFEIMLMWSGITAAEVDQIRSDYVTNSELEFEVNVYDSNGNSTMYNKCHWAYQPAFRPQAKAGGRFDGDVRVFGNEQ